MVARVKVVRMQQQERDSFLVPDSIRTYAEVHQ